MNRIGFCFYRDGIKIQSIRHYRDHFLYAHCSIVMDLIWFHMLEQCRHLLLLLFSNHLSRQCLWNWWQHSPLTTSQAIDESALCTQCGQILYNSSLQIEHVWPCESLTQLATAFHLIIWKIFVSYFCISFTFDMIFFMIQ